jgi:hypothetical protein
VRAQLQVGPQVQAGPQAQVAGEAAFWQPQVQAEPVQGLQAQAVLVVSFMRVFLRREWWI